MLDLELLMYTLLFLGFGISKAHQVSLKVSWLWGVRCYWWLFACAGVFVFFYIHRLIKRAHEQKEANNVEEEDKVEEIGKDT